MSVIIIQNDVITYRGQPLTIKDGTDTMLPGSGVFIPKSNMTFAEAGLNAGNMSIAFQLQPVKSYKPGRDINPLSAMTAGVPLFIKMKSTVNILNS